MTARCLFTSRSMYGRLPRTWSRSYRTKGSKNKTTIAKGHQSQEANSPISSTSGILPSKRPTIIEHGSEHHQDLASFLAYVRRRKLSETSTVYQGTHYEYTVAQSLKRVGFDVLRTGRSSDNGIDLLGWWHLPSSQASNDQPLKVLLQCKAFSSKLGPKYIRELEGSFPGAPAYWHDNGVLGFLVASSEATKGMRDAMINSRLPLGFMQVSREGRLLQMLWNHQASLWGLQGYAVTTKFSSRPKAGDDLPEHEISLTWNGKAVAMGLNTATKTF